MLWTSLPCDVSLPSDLGGRIAVSQVGASRMTIAMCGAWRTAAVLAVLLSLATAARGGNSTQPESASCWDFGLGTQAGSSFSGGILGQVYTASSLCRQLAQQIARSEY